MGASLAALAELGAPGLPLVAEGDRSGIVVLKLGGASSEKPEIAIGCQGCDLLDHIEKQNLESEDSLTDSARPVCLQMDYLH